MLQIKVKLFLPGVGKSLSKLWRPTVTCYCFVLKLICWFWIKRWTCRIYVVWLVRWLYYKWTYFLQSVYTYNLWHTVIHTQARAYVFSCKTSQPDVISVLVIRILTAFQNSYVSFREFVALRNDTEHQTLCRYEINQNPDSKVYQMNACVCVSNKQGFFMSVWVGF